MLRWISSSLLLGSVLLLAIGCAGERVPLGIVQGRITYKDKPVTQGLVIFQNAGSGVAVFAELDENGTFQAGTHEQMGLPPGLYRVAVKPVPRGSEPPLAGMEKDAPPLSHPLIPARFHSVETSRLTVEVLPGNNPLVKFDLGR